MRISLMLSILVAAAVSARGDNPSDAERQAAQWRAEHRIIDMHLHLNGTTQHLSRAVKVLDAAGVGIGVNLAGNPISTVTINKDGTSEFQRGKAIADALFPGRFIYYMNLDYTGWDEPNFSDWAVKQVESGHGHGAAGLKEFKRLGLNLKDKRGNLIKIDDPKLDPMWKRLGELNMPVSIHVADPKAFWEPYNPKNERWKELGDHPNWWFGDTNKYPARMELLAALDRVIERHPKTKFVCVHFANNSEDLDWVEKALDRRPNMYADLAARIPEIGRHNPEKVRRLFIKHQDRILFATDFQVGSKLILGSSGNEPPPSDADAEVFYQKEWRWLETRDKDWPHMTPIQGDWNISSIGLPASVLRKIYFDNARKLLGRSMPLPKITARRISQDFTPDGNLDNPVWQTAKPISMEYESSDYSARPELATTVRALWSSTNLYLAYECPYTKLTQFEPPQLNSERFDMKQKGVSLWDGDVVEAFIASDPNNVKRYTEFEVAPTNEKLDLSLDGAKRDFAWSSGFETAVKVNKKTRTWICEMRIPLKALAEAKPKVGTQWRVNLYRGDKANKSGLAFSPTLTGTFHTPEKFGTLEFVE